MDNLQEIHLRKATVDDIDKIGVLLQDLIGDSLEDRRRYSQEALSSGDYVGILAELGDEIVGYIDLWGFPDPGHGAKLGIILSFIVAENFRKTGIGDRLVEEAVKEAEKRGFREFAKSEASLSVIGTNPQFSAHA